MKRARRFVGRCWIYLKGLLLGLPLFAYLAQSYPWWRETGVSEAEPPSAAHPSPSRLPLPDVPEPDHEPQRAAGGNLVVDLPVASFSLVPQELTPKTDPPAQPPPTAPAPSTGPTAVLDAPNRPAVAEGSTGSGGRRVGSPNSLLSETRLSKTAGTLAATT